MNQGDYEHSASILGLILQDLNDVDSVLSNIEDLQNVQDLLDALTLLESIIPKLDSINQALIETESDLGLAIEKTQESRIKVANYIIQLDSITQDLEVFGERLDTKTVSLNFKQNEVLSDNPVLFAFPMLVAIIITFTSLILSNLFVLRQVTNPSYFRELISPTKDICFLFADYLINLFFILIQSAVLFLVGIYWIGIPFDTLFAFALTIFIASSLFIFIGMSIGYLIKSQNLSMLLTIFLVMLFFITSELLIPAPLISPFIRFFLELNPFVLLSNILKNIFVLNNPLSVNTLRLIVLGIFLFFSGILVYVSRKINKVRMKE